MLDATQQLHVLVELHELQHGVAAVAKLDAHVALAFRVPARMCEERNALGKCPACVVRLMLRAEGRRNGGTQKEVISLLFDLSSLFALKALRDWYLYVLMQGDERSSLLEANFAQVIIVPTHLQ